ncbi:hypothetical protein L7F22_052671 [Adiantum nelumboides]|nr:hypothetical protein [Adiantum nelumboides]
MRAVQNGSSNGHDTQSTTQNSPERRANSKRRRTRSNASVEVTADNEERKANPSTPRRLRRRVQATESEVEDITASKQDDKGKSPTMNKGKGKEKEDIIMRDESSPENGVNSTEVDGPPNPPDSSIANALSSSNGESSSAQSMPSNATQNQNRSEVPSLDRPNSSSPADGGSSQPNSSDRHDRMRREIEQSLATAGANQREVAQQIIREGSTRPSMLSALLSDILGLRGARAGQEGQPNTTTNGTAMPIPSRNGGTSVIVQGALVSRTIPTNRTSSDRSSERSTQNDGATSTAQSNEAQPSESDTALPQTDTASSTESRGTGEAQAATIEEQASMLVRLLSIATAATAASLLSGSQARANNATTGENATESEPPQTNDATSQTAFATPASTTPSTTQDQGDGSSPDVQSSMQNSRENTTSTWAAQTMQSLRARFYSIGSRFRSRNGTTTEVRPFRARNESSLNAANIRRALVAAQANAQNQASGANRTSTTTPSRMDNGEAESGAPSLASLSNMLRDAIRDSLSHVGRGSGTSETNSTSAQDRTPDNVPVPTLPRSSESRPSTSSARSRIQSVRATLEAAREGHLNRGEEGSFDRFLYDLSRDLNLAVRAIPGREEGLSSEDDHLNTQAEGAGSNLQTGVNAATESTEIPSRQGDTRDGQLSFFRFFTFPEQRSAQTGSVSEPIPSGLLPCIVVGVRSLEHWEENGTHSTDADLLRTNRASESETQTEAQGVANEHNAHPLHGRNINPFERSQPGQAPLSRFLLFVSGGHYPPQHPLFHASSDEASRDLMVLMEFLGAMAAAGMKVNDTVTPEQIEKSDIRKVNGSKIDIEALTKLHQIMENTSEKCLICLEDWQDEGEQRRLLGCGHLFHAGCLDKWLISSKNSCPLCRRQAIDTSNNNGEGNASSAEA